MTVRFAAFLLAATLLAGCGGEVEFRLEAPERIKLAPDGSASFRVTGSLANETGETVTLEASTPCMAEDWRILGADDTVVVKPPETVCIQMLASHELADGEALPLAHRIEVPSGRLAAGNTYRLVFEFWGYSDTAELATGSAGGN